MLDPHALLLIPLKLRCHLTLESMLKQYFLKGEIITNVKLSWKKLNCTRKMDFKFATLKNQQNKFVSSYDCKKLIALNFMHEII